MRAFRARAAIRAPAVAIKQSGPGAEPGIGSPHPTRNNGCRVTDSRSLVSPSAAPLPMIRWPAYGQHVQPMVLMVSARLAGNDYMIARFQRFRGHVVAA